MLQTSNYIKHTTKNPLKKWLINYFYKVLFSLITDLKIKTVLDAGCGEGFSLNQLRKKFPTKIYTGIDASAKAINLGRKMFPKIKLKTGNIYRLPDKNRAFDLVLCTEVLEHLTNPAMALKEIKRAAKKYCLFSVPNEPWFRITRLGNDPEHINHWTKNKFSAWLKQNQFKILQVRNPFPWTMVLTKI